MSNKKAITTQDQLTDFLLYNTPNGRIKVEVLLYEESIWLPQRRIAELFGVERSVVTKHLANIFGSNELVETSVCANFAHTAGDGKRYNVKYYNLDAILSVGYRVNSHQATQLVPRSILFPYCHSEAKRGIFMLTYNLGFKIPRSASG